MKKQFITCLLGILYFPLIFAQLNIKVLSLPANTPAEDSIYIAGSFNEWTAGNPEFILQKQDDGTLQIELNPEIGLVKFKFTRGNWETVEANAQGGFLPDRTLNYNGSPTSIEINILNWEDLSGNNNDNTTASPNVQVITNFSIPQLSRNRRIWIYLPPNYSTSEKNYPVLYMHDGQNVFDRFTSFSGEWEVDESLNRLFGEGDEGIIVVAIDNGAGNRLNEYTPWANPQYGGGEGSAYVDFIIETLKPFIDNNYRTRPERDYTGIMGSSLGGLISMYAAIEHQDIFSKAGIFSPSFWFSDEAYTHVSTTGKEQDMKIYLLAGEQESESMVPDLNAMYNTLRNAGFEESELFITTDSDGQHSEWYWAREFPDAYTWLYADNRATGTEDLQSINAVILKPNPASDHLQIETKQMLKNPRLQIYSLDGRLIQPSTYLYGMEINTSFMQEGIYIFNIYSENQLVNSQKVVIQR